MKEIIYEVKRNVLGPCSVGYYISAFIFCFIALLIMVYYRSAKRDKENSKTPLHYSFHFMLWDNTKKIGAGMLVMFVIFRFSSEFLNTPLSMNVAMGVGFFISMGLEPAIEMLMTKYESICNALSMPRAKYMEKLVQKSADEIDNAADASK